MGYSAAQLVSLACQICQCPGRTVSGGQLLNLILANYAQTMDLDTIRLDGMLNIGPQTTIPFFYSLPDDYLRMYDINYNVQGTTFTPKQFTLAELDQEYTAQGIANYPEWYATDVSKSPVEIAFFPPPSVPLTILFRYRPQTSDIVNPESSAAVPWFANQLILLKDLCIQLGDVAGGDDRSDRWEKEVERRMSKYLQMDDDKEGYSQTVKLDGRFFRNPGRLPPSKKLGF